MASRGAMVRRKDSGHGAPNRNAGHFTRGSQLIGHQWSMWLRGARIPPLFWLGIFLLILVIKLNVILDNHEFQMIAMKCLAWCWHFIGFSEMKPVNLTLRSGAVFQTYMGYVPHVDQVQIAWAKLVASFLGALGFATLFTIPFTVWFVVWSKQRGRTMLDEHHERGVELIDAEDLAARIHAHNEGELRKIAAKEFPALPYPDALAQGFKARKKIGLVTPYRFATLPYPFGQEQAHAMIVGTTGAGKSTAMRALVAQALERGDSLVIFDLTGSYMSAFYKPDRDHVLNLNDQRCRNWTMFNDCKTQSDFVSAATALIPDEHGGDGGFWQRSARTIVVETCISLMHDGLTTNQALSDELLKATLARIHARLKGTVAESLTAPDVARMAQSIRAVIVSYADALRHLPTEGAPFSIRDWIKDETKGASILFITAQYAHLDMSRALLTLWMNIAINSIMTMPETRFLRTWFLFDELGALHQLPALPRGLQTARVYGGAFVLGVHSFAALRQVYGEDGARNIVSLTGTKLILRTSDRDTAEELSKIIGYHKLRTVDEAYSYGAHTTRDASTLSATSKEEALVYPDDITSLKNLHGYVRFPEDFPSTYVRIPYVEYPRIAEGFIEAEPPPPLKLPPEGEDHGSSREEGDTGEAGGRERDVASGIEEGKDQAREVQAKELPVGGERPEEGRGEAARPADLVTMMQQERGGANESDDKPAEMSAEQEARARLTIGKSGRLAHLQDRSGAAKPSPQDPLAGRESGKDAEESLAAKLVRRDLETDQGYEPGQDGHEHRAVLPPRAGELDLEL